MNENYVGHHSQYYGVEEHRLIGGKGDGMRLFEVRNGKGLEFTVSADRCADISRLSFCGNNYGFFSPCGYVASQYYSETDANFTKSFTAGFLTTCGLTTVGTPCNDEGEVLPLHGTISTTPAEHIYYTIDEEAINIYATISDATLFGRKLTLKRKISCSRHKNTIKITDTVRNNGTMPSPLMLLYHMNMGYPLLDENAILHIPSTKVIPRNEHAKTGLNQWDKLITPKQDFEEQCYYHSFEDKGFAALFQPAFEKGIAISFDTKELDCFVEWKMMGQTDYVLGLEPGNCLPDGRDVMRERGLLKYIAPKEEKTYNVTIEMIENSAQWRMINTK
ncbi:MAG TPA: aldose 1-epimerase family protein [Ruminiclostridium sp.]